MGNYPRLVIAGLRGGSGKTTISLAIARAWKNKGLKVVPFKKGPDYIDAGWLASAAGNPCYNLDPFLIGHERLLKSFIDHSEGSDVAVIEGNRGLFDGMDEEGSYSTAAVAKTLKSPVILVVDCTKATRTVAAMVLGARKFDEQARIKAVILNHIAGSRHESVIRKAIEKYCDIPVLGAIPRLESGVFPERHMGLMPFQEHPQVEKAIEEAAGVVKQHVDVDGLLEIARETEPLLGEIDKDEGGRMKDEKIFHNSSLIIHPSNGSLLKVGVIKDSAFQFYYPENLDELKSHGATIIEMSALTEKGLPDIDALYIGGGFPETHAITLAENIEFINSLKSTIMRGLPVYAECGGLMYLGRALMLEDRMYPMAGVFPFVFSLGKRPMAHGYSIVEVVKENPFYPEGVTIRGHEFHYSGPINAIEGMNDFFYAFRMKRGQGIHEKMDGICYKNVFATYTHIHAYGAREWVEGMIRCAGEYKKVKSGL